MSQNKLYSENVITLYSVRTCFKINYTVKIRTLYSVNVLKNYTVKMR